ncbi:MAG: hypothetical protein E7115_02545 [Bacteroidales bacterium]|nr:hypothetical protein [Bacteroidales bacterium]
MSSKFLPDSEALKKTDFRNPSFDKSNKKSVLLLLLSVAMLVVVFIPWFCVGVEVEDVASVKLRAFGFQTWYGIVGGVLALIALAGALYRHLSLSFCASLAAVLVGIYALNTYPAARLVYDIDGDIKKDLKSKVTDNDRRSRDYYDDYYDDYYESEVSSGEKAMAKLLLALEDGPKFKVPAVVVQGVAMLVETIDQDAVYELIEDNGGKEVLDNIDIINHRLGAILYLIFAALAAVIAYLLITRPNKEVTMEHPVPTADDVTTLNA